MKKPNLTELIKDKQSIKITNLDFYLFYDTLESIEYIKNIKLWNIINLTIDALKPIQNSFKQDILIPKTDRFKEYSTKLEESVQEYLKKASDNKTKDVVVTFKGKEITKNVWDVDMEDPNIKEGLDTIVKSLEEEYTEDIKLRNEDIKEYNDYMLEEFPLDLDTLLTYKLDISEFKDSDLPENKEQAKIIYKLIKNNK